MPSPHVSQSIAQLLSSIGDDDPTSGSFTEARQKAKEGDPFPLFHLQWPNAVLDDFQKEFLTAVFSRDVWAIYTKGSTGSGKGAVTSQAICLWYDVWRDARIILTSVTLNHAQTTLFAETKRWWNKMTIRPKGFVGSQKVDHNEEHFILVVNPMDETGEGFSGKHGPHTMFVFDEASSVDPTKFDLAENQAKKFIAISNPRTNLCRFKKAFPNANPDETQTYLGPYGKIFCQTISAMGLMNYRMKRLSKPLGPIGGIEIKGKWFDTGEEIPERYYKHVQPLIPGQRCYDEILGDLDTTSPSYSPQKVEWQVYARFPVEDVETQVILPSWLSAPVRLWKGFTEVDGVRTPYKDTIPVRCLGLDVAASEDGDVSVLAGGSGNGCRGIAVRRSNNVMELLGWVQEASKELWGLDITRGGVIAVDSDGLGRGVGERLQELGAEVIAIHGAGRPTIDPEIYQNWRAQLYGQMGQRLRPDGQFGYDVTDPQDTKNLWALPDDDALHEELCVPEKIFNSSGKYRITPKSPIRGLGANKNKIETIREKLGRSPDRADALVYLYEAVRQYEGDCAPEINRPLLMLSEDELAEEAKEKSGQFWPTSWQLMEIE